MRLRARHWQPVALPQVRPISARRRQSFLFHGVQELVGNACETSAALNASTWTSATCGPASVLTAVETQKRTDDYLGGGGTVPGNCCLCICDDQPDVNIILTTTGHRLEMEQDIMTTAARDHCGSEPATSQRIFRIPLRSACEGLRQHGKLPQPLHSNTAQDVGEGERDPERPIQTPQHESQPLSNAQLSDEPVQQGAVARGWCVQMRTSPAHNCTECSGGFVPCCVRNTGGDRGPDR